MSCVMVQVCITTIIHMIVFVYLYLFILYCSVIHDDLYFVYWSDACDKKQRILALFRLLCFNIAIFLY